MAKGEGIVFRARQEAGEAGRLGEVRGGGQESGIFSGYNWVMRTDRPT